MHALSSMLAASLVLAPAPAASENQPEPNSEPAPAPALDDLAVASERGPLGCRGQRNCVRLTIGSIGLGTLGVAGIVTGSVLLTRPDRVDLEQPIFVTSTRPAGLVTVMVSVGVTLTAALMLIAARRGLGPRHSARIELDSAGLHF